MQLNNPVDPNQSGQTQQVGPTKQIKQGHLIVLFILAIIVGGLTYKTWSEWTPKTATARAAQPVQVVQAAPTNSTVATNETSATDEIATVSTASNPPSSGVVATTAATGSSDDEETASSEPKPEVKVNVTRKWPSTEPHQIVEIISNNVDGEIVDATTDLPPGRDYAYLYPPGWKVQVSLTQGKKVEGAFNIGTNSKPEWVLTKLYRGEDVKALRLNNKDKATVKVTFRLTKLR